MSRLIGLLIRKSPRIDIVLSVMVEFIPPKIQEKESKQRFVAVTNQENRFRKFSMKVFLYSLT
ncbi:MAG TPA: hypothetical protein DHU93_05140 [Algoriphagus sp.]|nr:hypothetical protein [Algoriphagus sp.]